MRGPRKFDRSEVFVANRYIDMAKQFSLDSSDQIFYNNRANKLLKHTNILCFRPSSEGLFLLSLDFRRQVFCLLIFAYKYFEVLICKLFICENDLRVFLF